MTGRPSTAVSVVAMALALAGCSVAGGDETAPSTTSPDRAPAPVSAADLDVCGLLTTAEAATAIEAPSVTTEAWYFEAPERFSATAGCTYESDVPDSLAKVVIHVVVHRSAGNAEFYFDEDRRRNDYAEIPDLADRALVPLESVGDLEVVSGAYRLAVSVETGDQDAPPDDDDDAARRVVELALSRLPAASDQEAG